MKKSKPQYYARPTDGTIFSLNEDGETYSIKESKEVWSSHSHNKYSQEQLKKLGFYKVALRDFKKLRAIGDEYYAYLSWSNRSDGHGGIQGGTIEEFRKIKKYE